MQDRVPTPGKENRVRIRLDDGQTIEGVFEYADDASVQGSSYNKANVLPDDVCTALGIGTSAEPKDAFAKLVNKINSVSDIVSNLFFTGFYDGNDESTSKTQSINLGFQPRAVIAAVINRPSSASNSSQIAFTSTTDETSNGLYITENGFVVRNVKVGSTNYANMNSIGNKYSYLAIK